MESTASVANAPITKIMYKICCKDPSITDVYVGQTTNVVSRRHGHKSDCNNAGGIHYNYYVYQFIRANGGWDAWDLVPIETYGCTNKTDVATRERYWVETLGATLNKHVPGRERLEYITTNKDILKQWRGEYYTANKDVLKQQQAEYRSANKDTAKLKNAEYRIANQAAIKEQKRRYSERHSEEIKQNKANYYAANKDAINQRRREKRAALK